MEYLISLYIMAEGVEQNNYHSLFTDQNIGVFQHMQVLSSLITRVLYSPKPQIRGYGKQNLFMHAFIQTLSSY